MATPDERLARLTPLQRQVTQQGGTERPFANAYWDHHADGTYTCVVCDRPLFASAHKFDSGTGWPSYDRPLAADAVSSHEDRSHGMLRVEVRCSSCGAHLGHRFPDGPASTGQRYCINSASLDFRPT
jgi:peptide-methionine (R)-S-oxide reductase